MPNERLSMRYIKDVLRLKFEANLSHRQIAHSLKIGIGTVSLYLNRARDVGLVTMHQELKRKGVTRQLLWEEYKQAHGDNGDQYSQFCYRDDDYPNPS